ncbi:hypothetical protein [Dyella mobilis]|uniref:Bacteriophage protein n=1 Tax=Dyella mobilis TaxID=1849582 RepID=A0ABS2KK69_9GAMM|nr:hypothetical protein [Dyella mobilis]MBM7131557.1 hypothetical protein [Dyella mobilis]GLQ96472.1 hypothetical protein GCM10007863_08900 [Dyella mobilis]
MGVKVTKDKVSAALRSIHQLVKQDVMVGVPLSNDARSDGAPITNAEIGYIQENGAPAANIPPRPHLVPGVEGAEKQIGEQLKKGARAACDENKAGVMAALDAAGLIGEMAVKAKITSIIPPPLKASTLAARERRGRTGETPLLDTARYRNSITHVIRPKKT